MQESKPVIQYVLASGLILTQDFTVVGKQISWQHSFRRKAKQHTLTTSTGLYLNYFIYSFL
jgi:hypothetical protein